jgi:hypothetical protein
MAGVRAVHRRGAHSYQQLVTARSRPLHRLEAQQVGPCQCSALPSSWYRSHPRKETPADFRALGTGRSVQQGRRVPAPHRIAALATALLGALDEAVQALLPSRVFDPAGILVNPIAAVMAVAASITLRSAHRRKTIQ